MENSLYKKFYLFNKYFTLQASWEYVSSQSFQDVELETEDEPFRPINANGILIEIRAFDTTYFEIYSDNKELIIKISKIYNVKIERK